MGKKINIKSDPLAPLNDLWWYHLPRLAGRISQTLAAFLTDGDYFSAWSIIGAFVLPIAFGIGFLLGWVHFYDVVYTFSLLLMALLLMVSHLGAAIGSSLWLGYVLGDFFLYALLSPSAVRADNLIERFVLLIFTRALAYALLAILLIVIPVTTRGLTRLTLWRIKFFAKKVFKSTRPTTAPAKKRTSAVRVPREAQVFLELPLQAFLEILLVYLWTQAVGTLIRPLWTWQGTTPPTPAIQPLQATGWVLAIIAAFVGTVRAVLEFLAARRPVFMLRSLRLRRALTKSGGRHSLLVGLTTVPPKAFFLTFLMGGIINSWIEATILFFVLGFMLFVREIISTFLGFWTRVVSYVPIVFRFLFCLIVSYLVAWPIMQFMWSQTNTFLPVLIGSVISLILFSIFLPGRETPMKQQPVQAGSKP